MQKDAFVNFKHLRKTKHTHNPVDDARGNAEALLQMKEMGLKNSALVNQTRTNKAVNRSAKSNGFEMENLSSPPDYGGLFCNKASHDTAQARQILLQRQPSRHS